MRKTDRAQLTHPTAKYWFERGTCLTRLIIPRLKVFNTFSVRNREQGICVKQLVVEDRDALLVMVIGRNSATSIRVCVMCSGDRLTLSQVAGAIIDRNAPICFYLSGNDVRTYSYIFVGFVLHIAVLFMPTHHQAVNACATSSTWSWAWG